MEKEDFRKVQEGIHSKQRTEAISRNLSNAMEKIFKCISLLTDISLKSDGHIKA